MSDGYIPTPYERWPGFNEQSWAERFAALDEQSRAREAAFMKALDQKDVLIAKLRSQTPVSIADIGDDEEVGR